MVVKRMVWHGRRPFVGVNDPSLASWHCIEQSFHVGSGALCSSEPGVARTSLREIYHLELQCDHFLPPADLSEFEVKRETPRTPTPAQADGG